MKKDMQHLLLSAAIGDIAGSVYEFDPCRDYESINLLDAHNDYTDDSVCTFAVAEAMLEGWDIGNNLARRCAKDPHRGYGGRFGQWIYQSERMPYYSFGNGSAMRVSPAAFLASSAEEATYLAALTALPTHNHPEGVKGAVAVALATYYLLRGEDKAYVREHVLRKFYPSWDKSYAEVKDEAHFNEICQETVPQALVSFLTSHDYADALRLAIALGADADTLGAIVGPMAYACYGEMPAELIARAEARLPQWMLNVSRRIDERAAETDRK